MPHPRLRLPDSKRSTLATRRIDLHAHSTASDGTSRPAELVVEAAGAGLDVVALTDHDTTGGYAEATAALPAGTVLVPGAEISCVSAGISLHLLAYLFDPHEPTFRAARRRLRQSRVGRARRMVGALEMAGTGVTWEQVSALAGGTVGRPHVARALVARGLVPDVSAAFSPEWIGTGGRFWVGKLELDAREAVGLVRGAGGVSVFAHPSAARRGWTVGDDVIADLAEAGLVGLEVDHVDHEEGERSHLRGLAAELGLVTTGGSDYHGQSKAVRLGACLTSEAAYGSILERATGAAPVTA